MQQRISIRSTDCLTDNGKSGTSPEFFSMIQNRKLLGMIAFVIAVGVCGAMAQAQAPQVALLGGGSASGNAGRIEAFRQGLRELGYTEGKTFCSNNAGLRGNWIAWRRSPPNWCGSRWTPLCRRVPP